MRGEQDSSRLPISSLDKKRRRLFSTRKGLTLAAGFGPSNFSHSMPRLKIARRIAWWRLAVEAEVRSLTPLT
ncbi:MAG: hypothetical protein AUJ52_14860 [Elusimicrobia bacterium CG1_02_63_36]|nr:MAG: hypothetical protein AUJ52_14860 [Elusimicrobia bacterium CG1_02_63_36]